MKKGEGPPRGAALHILLESVRRADARGAGLHDYRSTMSFPMVTSFPVSRRAK
jgi:hypothetical protein